MFSRRARLRRHKRPGTLRALLVLDALRSRPSLLLLLRHLFEHRSRWGPRHGRHFRLSLLLLDSPSSLPRLGHRRRTRTLGPWSHTAPGIWSCMVLSRNRRGSRVRPSRLVSLLLLFRRRDYDFALVLTRWLLLMLPSIMSRIVPHPHRLVMVLWWRSAHVRWWHLRLRRRRGPSEWLRLPMRSRGMCESR
jgi:hypothetical protein